MSESPQIMRSARFRPCARKPHAAERLHPNHRPDHRTVDVNIPGINSLRQLFLHTADAALNTEGQPVAELVNLLDEHLTALCFVTDDMKDGSENLIL